MSLPPRPNGTNETPKRKPFARHFEQFAGITAGQQTGNSRHGDRMGFESAGYDQDQPAQREGSPYLAKHGGNLVTLPRALSDQDLFAADDLLETSIHGTPPATDRGPWQVR
jgi:hypothetical protein